MRSLEKEGFAQIRCALRDELLSPEDKASLPKATNYKYLFVNTESSLHTLGEVAKAEQPIQAPLFITMADTILKPVDLRAFVSFCRGLGPNESAILATPYVNDEKPLVVELSQDGYVSRFGGDAKENSVITSGMYCLSPAALTCLEPCLNAGMQKMRNFLAHLVEKNQKIRAFVVEKTIDIDHPEDLADAEKFLLEGLSS